MGKTKGQLGRITVTVPRHCPWREVKDRAEVQAAHQDVRLTGGKPLRLTPRSAQWPSMTLALTSDVWLFEVRRLSKQE